MIVVDASLAVKWYVLETQTSEALNVLDEHGGGIKCPDIFVAGVVGALVRRANMDASLRAQSEAPSPNSAAYSPMES